MQHTMGCSVAKEVFVVGEMCVLLNTTLVTSAADGDKSSMVALFFATPAWRFAPRFNPHAISLGDVGQEPAVGEVFEAATRLLRGNKL